MPRQDRGAGRSDPPSWRSDPFPPEADSDLPPWAGPGIYANRPGRKEIRPPADPEPAAQPDGGGGRRRRGRAAAARLRKSRRKVLIRGAAAVVIAIAIAVGLLIHYRGKPVPVSDFITTLQPGEFRSVPSACGAVGAGTLSQYLPGTRKVLQSIASSTQSECSFTVDARPVFRVLGVTSQAFGPRVLAAGNGGATYNAIYTYAQLQQALASPPRKSRLPKAQISQLTGLGQAGLSALQVLRVGGDRMDLVTILVRDRNALITITMQGQASGGGYGPVSVAQLQAGAVAAARQVLAGVAAGQKVSG